MRESFHWRYVVGFVLILIGAACIFNPFAAKTAPAPGSGPGTSTVETPTFPIYSSPSDPKES